MNLYTMEQILSGDFTAAEVYTMIYGGDVESAERLMVVAMGGGSAGGDKVVVDQKTVETTTVSGASQAGWLLWSGWTACSATCGNGYHIRVRGCDNGVPGVAEDCQGESFEVSVC